MSAGQLHAVLLKLDQDAQAEICEHLRAPGRLMEGKSLQDLIDVLDRVARSGASGDVAQASATDRAVIVALMGGIGGMFTTPGNATESLMSQLRDALQALGHGVPTQSHIDAMRQVGGSRALALDKRVEREIIAVAPVSNTPGVQGCLTPAKPLTTRSALHRTAGSSRAAGLRSRSASAALSQRRNLLSDICPNHRQKSCRCGTCSPACPRQTNTSQRGTRPASVTLRTLRWMSTASMPLE